MDILVFGAFCGRFDAALSINTENCTLLGYDAAVSGNSYRRFGTTHRS